MAGKPIRLGKAAGELNVGMSTLVEFLGSKGIKIDVSPNTKLEEEHYDILRKEFAADQSLKEQSKFSAVKREKRESVSIRDKEEETTHAPQVEEDDSEPISAEEIKRNIIMETPVAKVAEPVVEEPKVEEEAEQKTVSSGDVNVSVIGKIDLDKINSKTRPDKKKHEENKPKPVAPTPVEAVKPVVEKAEEVKVVVPEANVEESEAEGPKEIETIRVERKVLTGPTVLGRIELPVERPKTPNQKSAAGQAAADARKKRKRIKKVDPAKQPNAGTTPTANTPAAGGGTGNRPPARGGNKFAKPEIKERDIQKEIKDTLARLSNQGGKSKASKNRRAKRDNVAQRRQDEALAAEMDEKILKLTEFVTVSELASMMNIQPTQVISVCMSLGIFVSINQRLDAETIHIVADEFGFETEFVSAEVQESIPIYEDKEEDLINRPPIITVMGHVDHGKTSLLDRIRNANVIEGEAGGITQHIGAYSVTLKDGRKMTFLDTPGHEAFTAMRARGAQVTDVAIILVAADDDVMPQTKEAIAHSQAANVPMVFAINKIDKAGANPDKIREQLSQMNILVEDWGGKYQVQEISAKQGLNIEELLDKVLLEAEMLTLRANPNKNALGTVIESSLDKGKGYVTNMLVESGTLKVGDVILVGRHYGRVRAMHDEKGVILKEAGPSQPVSVLGINGAPSAGDKFHVLDDEKEAKSIATKREQLYREQGLRTTKHITLDEIGRRLAIGDFKELNIIIKGDVDGSIEALSDTLLRLSTEEIQINIVHKGVGAISEADVNLASASDAIIIGFQVRPTVGARKLAETEQIDIRLYSIIYKAIDEIKAAMEGMLSPDIEEKIIGSAEVRETFDITKVGTIAGCYVLDGLIKRSNKIRLIRDGIVIHTGVLGSLKRFKDDVREVKNNYECGLNIDKFDDIKPGDIIESFEEVEVARKL
ncbi:MAG: translation initiation factor IF-2 [Crocinitomicaceae bacterium]|jgi:translation initiation factor IF-2|nr:translation initiation factor IF-2 [Crocinitomicaceae bacterium]MDP5011283.1 translation initiation factor IF-2 [Crocinitomicaceae bacterium]